MNELMNKLLDTGILIGSRAWGGDTINSDYDLVFDDVVAKNILVYFDKIGISYELLAGSSENTENKMHNIRNIKVNLGDPLKSDMVINIITYKKEDLEKIHQLNTYMSSIYELTIGQACKNNKAVRIHVVQSFLDFAFNNVLKYKNTSKKDVPKIDIDEDDIPLGYMWDGDENGSGALLR